MSNTSLDWYCCGPTFWRKLWKILLNFLTIRRWQLYFVLIFINSFLHYIFWLRYFSFQFFRQNDKFENPYSFLNNGSSELFAATVILSCRSQSFRHQSSTHSSVVNVGASSISAHPLLPLGENTIGRLPLFVFCTYLKRDLKKILTLTYLDFCFGLFSCFPKLILYFMFTFAIIK